MKTLGVSHLVWGVSNLDKAESFLKEKGYSTSGTVLAGENPKPKVDYVDGALPETFNMRLMVSANGKPAVELLEHRLKSPESLKGPHFDASGSMEKLVIHTHNIDETFGLWSTLGYELKDNTTQIRGAVPSSRLAVQFAQDQDQPAHDYLNQDGIVCLSFFCPDADKLCETLKKKGYKASDCFTLSPFGKTLRIFFVRNKTGEIYEFLSTHNRSH